MLFSSTLELLSWSLSNGTESILESSLLRLLGKLFESLSTAILSLLGTRSGVTALSDNSPLLSSSRISWKFRSDLVIFK